MYIKVSVTPSAKKDSIIQVTPDHFKVSVKAKPERNMANKAVVLLVADYLKVPLNKVRMISGHHHHSKILSVDSKL